MKCPQRTTAIRHDFERDAIGRLVSKRTEDGSTDYRYDAAENLLSITFTDNKGEKQQLDYTYDANGQLLSETNSAGLLQYRYDELGNLQTLVLPDQRELNHLYYGSGHLHQINLNGRVISDFERDAVHDEVLRTQGMARATTPAVAWSARLFTTAMPPLVPVQRKTHQEMYNKFWREYNEP